MKLKDIIGSMASKFAALVLTFGLAGGAWGADPVAKIGETSYDTLADAIANVAANNTIQLLANITGDVTIPAGTPNCTINLGEFTINGTIVNNSTGSYKLQAASASTEVHNAIVNNVGSVELLTMTYDGSAVNYGTNFKIGSSCTLDSAVVNRTGIIELYQTARYGENARVENYDTLKVWGGASNLIGATIVNHGNVSLTFGGYPATFVKPFILEADAVLSSVGTGAAYFNGKVTNKGSLSIAGRGSKAYFVFNELENCDGATFTATKATLFNEEPVNNGTVIIRQESTSYPVAVTNDTWTWLGSAYSYGVAKSDIQLVNKGPKYTYYPVVVSVPAGSVAQVNGNYYTSLSDAMANVPAYGTIALLDNITLTSPVTINKNCTISGAYTISANGTDALIVGSGCTSLMLQNLTVSNPSGRALSVAENVNVNLHLSSVTLNGGTAAFDTRSGASVTASDHGFSNCMFTGPTLFNLDGAGSNIHVWSTGGHVVNATNASSVDSGVIAVGGANNTVKFECYDITAAKSGSGKQAIVYFGSGSSGNKVVFVNDEHGSANVLHKARAVLNVADGDDFVNDNGTGNAVETGVDVFSNVDIDSAYLASGVTTELYSSASPLMTAYNGNYYITVAAAAVHVEGISLNEDAVILAPGESVTLTATFDPADSTDKEVVWNWGEGGATTAGEIADVAVDGTNATVTANGVGTFQIWVTAHDSYNGEIRDTCTVTVVAPQPTYVAQIGETDYETLAGAIEAAALAGTETTIKLLADVTLSEAAVVPVGANVILNLNGKTISGALSSTAVVQNYGTLKIVDAATASAISALHDVIDGGATVAAIVNSGVVGAVEAAGKIKNTTLSGTGHRAVANYSGATLTVEGGILGWPDQLGNALYNEGTATIKSGIFVGAANYTINQVGGTLTVDGGIFAGNGNSGGFFCGAGTVVVNDAELYIQCSYNSFYVTGGCDVTINDGTYRHSTVSPHYQQMFSLYRDSDASTLTINDGTFTYENTGYPTKELVVLQSGGEGTYNLEINGGNFTGASSNWLLIWTYTAPLGEGDSAYVTGGTFNTNPESSDSDYNWASHCVTFAPNAAIVDNDNGTWTIVDTTVDLGSVTMWVGSNDKWAFELGFEYTKYDQEDAEEIYDYFNPVVADTTVATIEVSVGDDEIFDGATTLKKIHAVAAGETTIECQIADQDELWNDILVPARFTVVVRAPDPNAPAVLGYHDMVGYAIGYATEDSDTIETLTAEAEDMGLTVVSSGTYAAMTNLKENMVATIDNVPYLTLAEAIAAVPTTGAETTITMIANSAEPAVITVASGKNVVLDLNGKTVSYTTDAKSVYFLTNEGTLTIKDNSANADGQILLTAQPDTGYSKETVTIYNCGGTLTLASGTIKNATAGGLAYAVNNSSNAWGSDVVSTFNMQGGTVSAPSGDAALRVYQNTGVGWKVQSKNYVNISGGTILDTGIFFDTYLYTVNQTLPADFAANDTAVGCDIDTVVNISGGTINGLIDMKIRHPYNTRLNITGGDFANCKMWVRKVSNEYGSGLASGTLSEPTDPMVYISGGKFAFVAGKAFGLAYDCGTSSWTTYEKPYAVSGGVFNVKVPETACAEGYIPVANTDTETKDAYPYMVGVAVAQIGTTKYESLAEAVEAVASGATIELIADDEVSLTGGGEITIDKSLTITGAVDANGEPLYTIYGKPTQAGANDIFITGAGTVTISNVKVEEFGCNAGTDAGHAPIYVSTHFTGTVNLDNVYVSKFNRGGVFLYGGTFNVKDCYIDCANSRSGAFTKGIEIKGTAAGTIADTVICNMERSSTTYSTAGIEVYGNGTITVDGCTILSDVDLHQSVKGTYGIVSSRVGEHDPSGGSLHVTDCWIDVSNAALSVADDDEYGPVNNYSIVVDGEDTYFSNYIATWSAGSSITVAEGEFNKDVYADAGTINITGGTFNNFLPDTGTGTISISGGIFDKEVSEEYCAEGYIPAVYDEDTGLYTVKQGEYVAEVYDDNYELVGKYETLAEAIAAVPTHGTVELIADVDLGMTGLVIAEGKNFTLDIGEYDITGTVNGKLITNNGTVVVNGTTGCIYNKDISAQGHDAFLNNGTATISGGWFGDSDNDKTNANAINRGAGFRNFGTATINGGHFTACDNFTNGGYAYAIINGNDSNNPTLIINNADVYGKNNGNIANNSGSVTVKDGTFSLTGSGSYYSVYSYSGDTVVEGGTFTKSGNSNSQFCVEVDNDNASNPGSIAVSGGNFTKAVPEEFCATGYIPNAAQDSETGMYTVKTGSYVAQIGTTKYESLQAALDAVEDGQKIVILTDITETSYATAQYAYTEYTDKSFTIDFNGKTVTTAASPVPSRTVFNFVNKGSAARAVTLTNGTITAVSGTYNCVRSQGVEGEDSKGLSDANAPTAQAIYIHDMTLNNNQGYGVAIKPYRNTTVDLAGTVINSDIGGNIDVQKDSKVVIHDGTFTQTSGDGATGDTDTCRVNVSVSYGGEAEILGGTFTSSKYCFEVCSSGGTIGISNATATAGGYVLRTTGGNGVIAVSGGKFSGNYASAAGDTISLTGGVYAQKPAATYAATGYSVVPNTDSVTSEAYPWTVAGVVASITVDEVTNYYNTLAAAFEAAQDGDTVQLLKDCETGTAYTHANPLVFNTANATLDLNGKTLTITYNMSLVFRCSNGVVKNGTIVPGVTDSKVSGDWCRYGLTIDSCTGVKVTDVVSTTGIAVGGDPDDNYTPGAGPATGVVFEGCTVTGRSTRYAVMAQNNSTATIKSGTYNAYAADGNVLYSGFKPNDGGAGSLTVTGGSFMGGIPDSNIGAIVISGGIFSKQPVAGLLAQGYLVVANEDAATKVAYPYMVALGNNVTFELGESAPTGAAKPSDGAYAVGAALPLPTYTSTDTAFAGWKVAGTDSDVIMALPAGMTGGITLVATWTGVKTVTVDAGESKTPTIKVTDDWIAQNVTNEVSEATTEKIQTALETEDDNGLKKWQNYVLGQSPSAKLSADAGQGAISAMPVTSSAQTPVVDTGFKVQYRLDKVDAAGTKETAGTAQDSDVIPLDLTEMEGSVAYYKTTAIITSTDENSGVSVEVPSDNTIGVLKVTSAAKATPVAVPWESLSGTGPISVADIVRTATLTPGDELKAWDSGNNKYKAWTLSADKTWEPIITSSKNGTDSADTADLYTVPRGSAVWLTRQDPSQPIYLVGEVSSDAKASVTLEPATKEEVAGQEKKVESWNLVGSTSTEPVSINALLGSEGNSDGDKVVVPTAYIPKEYVYVNGKWGYYDSKIDTEIVPGLELVKEVFVPATDDEDKIPAGTGFWYLNGSEDADKKINL